MIRRYALLLLLALAVPEILARSLAAPPPPAIGPGTVLTYDTGYWSAPLEHGGHFVSIPDQLTVVGREHWLVARNCRRDPRLVCVNTRGNTHLLDPWRLDGACVLVLRTGPLSEVDPNRPVECELPRRAEK